MAKEELKMHARIKNFNKPGNWKRHICSIFGHDMFMFDEVQLPMGDRIVVRPAHARCFRCTKRMVV